MSTGRRVQVSEVLPGDVIEWCGRPLVVCDIEIEQKYRRNQRRTGVLITGTEGGRHHRLHYFTHEFVICLDSIRERAGMADTGNVGPPPVPPPPPNHAEVISGGVPVEATWSKRRRRRAGMADTGNKDET